MSVPPPPPPSGPIEPWEIERLRREQRMARAVEDNRPSRQWALAAAIVAAVLITLVLIWLGVYG